MQRRAEKRGMTLAAYKAEEAKKDGTAPKHQSPVPTTVVLPVSSPGEQSIEARLAALERENSQLRKLAALEAENSKLKATLTPGNEKKKRKERSDDAPAAEPTQRKSPRLSAVAGVAPEAGKKPRRSEEAMRRRAEKRGMTLEEYTAVEEARASGPQPSAAAPEEQGRGAGATKAALDEDGAWLCGSCGNQNFASRKICNSKTCRQRRPKPGEVVLPLSAKIDKKPDTKSDSKKPAHLPALAWPEQAGPERIEYNRLLRERHARDPDSLTEEEKERADQLVARDERKKDKKANREMEKDARKNAKKLNKMNKKK